MFINRLFRPVLMSEEGLDTAAFFGDQGLVDETTLPDAAPELLEDAPEPGAVDQLPADADQADPSKTTQGQPQGKKQFVPLGALQEERNKRQQEQEQNRVLQARMDQVLQLQQQQLQQQQQAQQQAQQPAAPQIPAFLDDPEGHVKALTEQFNNVIRQQNEQIQALSGHSQANNLNQQLAMEVSAAEATFRAAEPNYDAALQHFNTLKVAEYMAFGYNEAEARQQLARDYQGVAIAAKQTGTSAPERLFNIAKALGFKPAAPDTPAGGLPQQGQPPKQPNTSLSSLPGDGRAPDQRGAMTGKQVAQMTNEEFDAFFDEMARNSVQKPAF